MTSKGKTNDHVTCGACSEWRETRQCPGSGFCHDTKASTTKVGDVPLSCRLLPDFTECQVKR